MKHKFMILFTCLFMAGILTACNPEFSKPYNINNNMLNDALSSETSKYVFPGFASDLCVYESEKDINTENVNAEAFGLFDNEGLNIRSRKNLNASVYPASTTKILTCLLALELCDLSEDVIVPKESEISVAGSSMADLKPGDRLKMEDMLYALMVPSGNDAAAAIAIHISGSIEEFAELMNKRALELGATHSNFTNPHGLPDDNHYTTVYDLYLIFNEASKNDIFRNISSAKAHTVKVFNVYDQSEREVTWTSGNGFYNGKFSLNDGISYYGGKTGHTNAAGYCLVLGGNKKDQGEFISIIMKAPGYDELYLGMTELTNK